MSSAVQIFTQTWHDWITREFTATFHLQLLDRKIMTRSTKQEVNRYWPLSSHFSTVSRANHSFDFAVIEIEPKGAIVTSSVNIWAYSDNIFLFCLASKSLRQVSVCSFGSWQNAVVNIHSPRKVLAFKLKELATRHIHPIKRNLNITRRIDMLQKFLGLKLSHFHDVEVSLKLNRCLPNALYLWISVFSVNSSLGRVTSLHNWPVRISNLISPFLGERLSPTYLRVEFHILALMHNFTWWIDYQINYHHTFLTTIRDLSTKLEGTFPITAIHGVTPHIRNFDGRIFSSAFRLFYKTGLTCSPTA